MTLIFGIYLYKYKIHNETFGVIFKFFFDKFNLCKL